jgi:hypothetical protein
MELEVSAEPAGSSIRLHCLFHNSGPDRVYVLHVTMNTGVPELWIHHHGGRSAVIELGLRTLNASDVPLGMSVSGLSRSAGEPVQPGATFELERDLPIPLVVSQAFTHPAHSAARYTAEVDTLIVRCFYAAPPTGWEEQLRSGLAGFWDRIRGCRPRPTSAIRGYDLLGIPSQMVETSVALPQPVALMGLRA